MKPGQYVDDYRSFVARLKAQFGLNEAMSRAVGGGDFNAIGDEEARLLSSFGFSNGHSIIDVGCGSGRLAAALSRSYGNSISYLGLDIVKDLLDHAKRVSNPSYRFLINPELTIPADDASCDFIVFFSVITHLLHEQSFIYLRDARRALKPNGKIVVTFLESSRHWSVFERFVKVYGSVQEPLVMFVERSTLESWTSHLDLQIEQLISLDPLGQSIAVLTHSASPSV
jgi:ubiquinone/menaquinone biosynthesis C-methylase UbiE